MYTLAVTGGLGAGKSTAARYFARFGATVIELDRVAKDVLDESPHVREQLVRRFGDRILGPDGRVDHGSLAETAFGDPMAAADLNDIVHPATVEALRRLLSEMRQADAPPDLVVLEIPLLAEAPQLLEDVDAVMAIEASEESRMARAVGRGMSEADARLRIAHQAPDVRRAEIADVVITNGGDIETFEAALDRFYFDVVRPRLGSAG